jgi:hypothetical protein
MHIARKKKIGTKEGGIGNKRTGVKTEVGVLR